jgi:hypothetical protein
MSSQAHAAGAAISSSLASDAALPMVAQFHTIHLDQHPMKTLLLALLCAGLSAPAALDAADPPHGATPAAEHEWLKKFVGAWESKVEIFAEPGKPPLTGTGTETFEMLGGFWLLGRGEAEVAGHPYRHVWMLGYDPEKKRFIGSLVDSMSSHHWQYEGALDEGKTKLTLNTVGPDILTGKQNVHYREVTEFKGSEERTFTSSMKGTDGEWRVVLKVHARRKK